MMVGYTQAYADVEGLADSQDLIGELIIIMLQ